MAPDALAVLAVDLTRRYAHDGSSLAAVDQVSLTVARGEVVAIVGPSGSGKSTLLSLLAALDRPDAGQLRLNGVDPFDLAPRDRARFVRRACGFIAQGLTLLPQATAAENVEVPLLLDSVPSDERQGRVMDALERVGITALAAKLPDELSGGEQQRVAIARALVHRPQVVFADEPTASLDSSNAQAITRLLVSNALDDAAAVVLVTHDPNVAAHAGRVLHMHSGSLA